MSGVWLDAVRRVKRAWKHVLLLWIVSTVIALPLTLSVRNSIATQLDASLEADTVASGGDYDWLQEFTGQVSGIATTLRPTVVGFPAVLDNVSSVADRVARPMPIVAAVLVYLLLLLFLSSGIVDRLARDRSVGAFGLLSACGAFLFPMLRLGLLMAIVYGALFNAVHPWLFGTLFERLTADMTAERSVFMVRFVLYLVFALGVGTANLLFDYARVRLVVEDRRSALGSLVAAASFIRRTPAAAIAIYLINVALFLCVLAAYALVAPGIGGTGMSMWIGFAVGQLYVAARQAVKLTFWASEIALFQSRLAHAPYVRRAAPARPDSPMVEAIRTTI